MLLIPQGITVSTHFADMKKVSITSIKWQFMTILLVLIFKVLKIIFIIPSIFNILLCKSKIMNVKILSFIM